MLSADVFRDDRELVTVSKAGKPKSAVLLDVEFPIEVRCCKTKEVMVALEELALEGLNGAIVVDDREVNLKIDGGIGITGVAHRQFDVELLFQRRKLLLKDLANSWNVLLGDFG